MGVHTENDMDLTIMARIVQKQAELYALVTEVEGMKVANSERDLLSESPAYNESEFQRMANEMSCIASDLHLIARG
jgi:hypothetical protein